MNIKETSNKIDLILFNPYDHLQLYVGMWPAATKTTMTNNTFAVYHDGRLRLAEKSLYTAID